MIQWQFILRLPKNWSLCVDRNYKIFSLLFQKLYHPPTIPLAIQFVEINHVITRLTHNSFRDWVRRLRMMHQPRSQALSRLCLPCPPNNKVMGRMGKGEKAWERCWWYTSVLAWLSQTSLGLFCSREINITFSISFYCIYACYRPRGWHLEVRMGLFKSSSCIMARDCRALELSFILHKLVPASLEGFSPPKDEYHRWFRYVGIWTSLCSTSLQLGSKNCVVKMYQPRNIKIHGFLYYLHS